MGASVALALLRREKATDVLLDAAAGESKLDARHAALAISVTTTPSGRALKLRLGRAIR